MGYDYYSEYHDKRNFHREAMARGEYVKKQCDFIRKIRDNAVNENVVYFIEAIEPWFYSGIGHEHIISFLRGLDLIHIDKKVKINTNAFNSSYVSKYSAATVDYYTVCFDFKESAKLCVSVNRSRSVVTNITYSGFVY